MRLRRSFEAVEGLLYGYRSRRFIRSVISCAVDLEGEYGKDTYYQDFLSHLISIVRHFEEFGADRRKYGNLIMLPDEEVELGDTKGNRHASAAKKPTDLKS